MLSDLADYLRREQEQAEQLGETFGIHAQLLRVLREADVPERYDVLIVDPPATEGPHLYNAIMATHSLVIPIEPSAKGKASIRGLESVVAGLQDQLDIEIGVLAAVPIRFKETRDQREMLDALEYSAPVVIGDRTSLMEGCWKQQCSAFRYVREYRDRRRDYEIETLRQYDELARYLEKQAQVDAPNPPEPDESDDQEPTESEDVLEDRSTSETSTTSAETSTPDTESRPSKEDIPYIFRRSRVTDERTLHSYYLRDMVDTAEQECRHEVQQQLGEEDEIPKADLREAALLVAYRRPGLIAEELRSWGYDMD